MTHIPDDLLIDIALGQPASDAEQSHLQDCDVCRTAIERFVMTTVTLRHSDDVMLIPPPARVWAAIQSELATGTATSTGSGPATDTGRAAPGEPRQPARPQVTRRGVSAWWLAAAVAIGLTVGAVGNSVLRTPEKNPAPTTIAAAPLDTLDTKQQLGTADLARIGTALDLQVSTQRLDAGSGYLEVWLINRDLKRMVSVGVLPSNATAASFPVSSTLIDQGYVIVDISREGFDANPAHSGDSLVRGQLVS